MLLTEIHGKNDFGMTPAKLSSQQLIDWITEHSKSFLSNNTPIFRGFSHTTPDLAFADTNNFHRKSSNAPNHYTLWLDNHPDWEKFPKRSKSYVGSPDFETASSFGDVYLVIPEDTALIGVCPANDLWRSFPKVPDDLHIFMMEMVEIAEEITGKQLPDDDYKLMKLAFDVVDIPQIKEINLGHLSFSDELTIEAHLETMEQNHLENLGEYVAYVLDPDLDFGIITAKDFQIHADVEVWVQGKICLIRKSELSKYPDVDEALDSLGTR